VKLYFKLDHVAGLRTAGGGREPDPAIAAALAELEGVDGLTIHLHADRAAVLPRDIQVLKETLTAPLNLELAPTGKNREFAFDQRPHMVTLVQEPKDVRADRAPLEETDRDQATVFLSALKDAGIRGAAFIRPTIDAVRWSNRLQAEIIVLDSSAYTAIRNDRDQREHLSRLADAAKLAAKLGMEVHAAGGIDYRNVSALAALPIAAVHVGHGLTARALLVGIGQAVRDFLRLVEKVRS